MAAILNNTQNDSGKIIFQNKKSWEILRSIYVPKNFITFIDIDEQQKAFILAKRLLIII
jgi:hypothetical protein